MEVICELLPVINTCNVFVLMKSNELVKRVEILGNRITLLDETSNEITLKLSGGVHLKSHSERDLQCEGNWLSFRAEIDHKTKIVSSVLLDIIREIPSLVLNPEQINDKIGTPIQLYCKCEFPISDKRIYTKICPLPTADWEHSSEDWFCHLHGNEKNLVKRKQSPQEYEIYFNELFFNLNLNTMQVDVLDDHLHCKGCSTEIGFKKGDSAKLWTYDVKWVDEHITIYEKKSTAILYSVLFLMEKESLGSSPRLVLEPVCSTKELLYIIIMDSHLELLVTNNSPLCEVQNSPSKKQRINEENCYSLIKLQCIKVLYKYKNKPDDESGLWIDDVNVNVLQCGKSFFQSIFTILENSNQCIPSSIRTVNDLKIGYVLKEN